MSFSCPASELCTDKLEINQMSAHISEKHVKASIVEYICSKCTKSYTRLNTLIKHIKKNHFDIGQVLTSNVSSSTLSFPQQDPSCHLPQMSNSFHNSTSDKLEKKKLTKGTEKRKLSNDCSSDSLRKKACNENSNNFDSTQAPIIQSQLDFATDLECINNNTSTVIYEKISAFVIALYANNNLSRALALQIIAEANVLVGSLIAEILKNIDSENKSTCVINTISKIIDNVFLNFNSDHKVRTEINKDENFIPFETIRIDSKLQSQRSIKGITGRIKPIQVQKMSIAAVLKKYLSTPHTFTKIMAHIEHCKKQENIMSPYQGTVWQKIEFSYDGKIVLPLCLYCDDFEINNPLSTSRGKAQLCGVYFSLLCIPEKYRSSLNNIFITQIHKSTDHKSCGNVKIFASIIEELKYLEKTGITLSIDGEDIQVYFSLLVVAGDNLGLNKVLGFNSVFTTDYCCRFCTMTIEGIRKNSKITQQKLRTTANYEKHSKKLSHGIVEACVFNELENYHVIDNASADDAHDAKEGYLCYVLGHVSHGLIRSGCFLLKNLNSKIQNFDYGPVHSLNKPNDITENAIKKKLIKVTVSQMRVLMIYFGFWVGEYIQKEEHKKIWKVYLIARKLMLCTESLSFTAEKLNQLDELANQLNEQFILQFKDTCKIKMHLQKHYSSMIRRLGPPILYSSLRFESEHQGTKKIMQSTTNRMNPAYTAAQKIQIRLCESFKNHKGFSSKISWGPEIERESYEFENQIIDLLSIETNETNVLTKWVSIYGTKYSENMCVVIGEEGNQNFGKIKLIAIGKDSKIIFCYKKLKVLEFDEIFQGYMVEEVNEWGKIDQSDLMDFKPRIISRLFNGNNYVVAMCSP